MGHMPIDSPGTWSALDRVVTGVVDTRAQIARLQAQEAALLAEAGELVLERTASRRASGKRWDTDLALREVTSELGAAMRLSDRSVQARMASASSLTRSFPATLAAFEGGRIDAAHVSAIIDAGISIGDPDVRAQYEHVVLEAAGFETPTRLRAIARIVAARLDPETVAELQRRARDGRQVRVIDLGDSMGRLLADVPAAHAYAILDRLTQMAYEVRDGGDEQDADAEAERLEDPRTLAELRADILVDMLLTAAPTGHGRADALGAIQGRVQITVPVLTAAGIGDEPALLAGYGPIDRETAARLAADAPGWDRVMTHPHTGVPLAVDRYHPSAELRRFLGVRDERCRFPGCIQRPWRCDVDHTVDAAYGGPTCHENLAHLCRRHHTVKHATAWTVRQLENGILEWTSPTGRPYVDKPPAAVQFVPSDAYESATPRPPADYGGDPPPF
ncbi:HNH endonuclease signature motif containing protein [Microbacterium sp. 2FI]|uniref:HNH endonuclease signature motif containing protein n=1 Tax=Microbacterium sp. 2FI TaxID=2502193 RepID=UPI0010FA3983|nr:HNH endonuclease signature motif containing protein [Microbacterium sp. 2FI]